MEQGTSPVTMRMVKCPNCSHKYMLTPEQWQTMRQAQQKVRCKKCGLLTHGQEFLEDFSHIADSAKATDGESSASVDTAKEPPKPVREPEGEKPAFVLSETSFPAMPALPGLKVKEYKVLTFKDKQVGGKFDPEKLELTLNSWAGQGWTVLAVITMPINAVTRQEEPVIVLERDKA